MRLEPRARTARGRDFELFARRFLHRQGLVHVASNFRSRRGEIDLVMLDDATLVFIEVRYRRSTLMAHPLETITPAKRSRITHAAEFFLVRYPQCANRPCRFDVVGITGSPDAPEVSWIKAAFAA